ncbi:ZIP zinc transporter-domain-containing protein [Aspergillus pseudoustus]|uniref:ZIP zinc transporter-domain-containing protein n=1 Tax=Aspergillus pseudoustus TaxID=1810923 RepID=A0ABR4IG29_9EURO
MRILLPVLAVASLARAADITGCHKHGDDVYCITESGDEVQVILETPITGDPPESYTDCHSHGDQQYCVDADGNDVQILAEGATVDDSSSSTNETSTDSESESSDSTEGLNCHFHAGVEHCVGAGESESGGSSDSSSCGLRERDYDIPLRIGTLFVVLVTSAIGVFLPMALMKLPSAKINVWVLTIVKQFGTGVILSTAFVHLYTHADLMFSNDCLTGVEYEATTSAIVMAGIFLSFLTEYIGHRYICARAARSGANTAQPAATPETTETGSNASKSAAEAVAATPHQHATLAGFGHHHGGDPTNPNTKVSVLVMEAGVIFHSILIGLTLVVAGDSFYKTLLVVIVFHQFFEGLALGARIALLPGHIFPSKAIMAGIFAIITPIGMAIGLGVINSFNGNERSTIITLGTLDALSAGILVWVGLVDMWARDWVIDGGDMMNAKIGHVAAGGLSLVSGMVLMSVLGKWA